MKAKRDHPRTATDSSAGDAAGPAASRRRVLCVAYFFPPLGGVSVTRMLSFIRHLPAAGWDPIVLAPLGASYPLRDPAGLAAVPGTVRVLRARSPEPQAARRRLARVKGLAGWPLERIRRAIPQHSGERSAATRPPNPGGNVDPAPARLRGPSLASLRRLVFFPDDQLLWLPFAVRAGYGVVRKDRVDAIYSTSSPVTAHLVAGILHQATGVPWVAEFRDPWVGNPLATPLPWFHRRLQRRLERWIITSASRVVFLSAETAVAFRRRYPGLEGRWRTVSNGYDAAELGEPRARSQRGNPFRLVYTGTLERAAEAAAFMAGVDLLVARRPEVATELAIDFFGYTSPQVEAIAAPYLVSGKLGSMIRFVPFAPRTEVLDRLREADACLVLLGNERGMSQFMPGKLFDYIGLDAPVLAIVPPGEVRSVLHKLEWGVVADPTPAGVADGLERLLAGEHRTGLADRDASFERRKLARELGSVLDEAAGMSGAA